LGLKYAHIWECVWPQIRVGGPLFWAPFLEIIEGSIFQVKNAWIVGALWGQKWIWGGQIRCIGPREPPGSKIRRSRTLKIWGMQISDVLAFIWDPNLHNWTPIDPPRPQKPPKISKNRVGDPGVTLNICLI